jgi:hypothetical protein
MGFRAYFMYSTELVFHFVFAAAETVVSNSKIVRFWVVFSLSSCLSPEIVVVGLISIFIFELCAGEAEGSQVLLWTMHSPFSTCLHPHYHHYKHFCTIDTFPCHSHLKDSG